MKSQLHGSSFHSQAPSPNTRQEITPEVSFPFPGSEEQRGLGAQRGWANPVSRLRAKESPDSLPDSHKAHSSESHEVRGRRTVSQRGKVMHPWSQSRPASMGNQLRPRALLSVPGCLPDSSTTPPANNSQLIHAGKAS